MEKQIIMNIFEDLREDRLRRIAAMIKFLLTLEQGREHMLDQGDMFVTLNVERYEINDITRDGLWIYQTDLDDVPGDFKYKRVYYLDVTLMRPWNKSTPNKIVRSRAWNYTLEDLYKRLNGRETKFHHWYQAIHSDRMTKKTRRTQTLDLRY